MKYIVVVGGHSTSKEDTDELTAFCAGVQQSYAAAKVTMVHVDQLSFAIAPQLFTAQTPDGHSLADADLVILRNKMRTYNTIAYCLSRYCQTQGIQFFNDYSAYFPGTKVAQSVVFYEQDVPFLKTVFAMDHAVLTAAIQKELSLPFILKDAMGAKGESNYLIHTLDELQERLRQQSDVLFIAQEYCPNDRDYRILLLGDEHLVIKRQGTADTHLNNTSQGGAALLAPADIPQEVLALSKKIASAMGLHVAGIDVMPHLETGAWCMLETNSQPQIFTGTFLDEKQQAYAAMLRQLLG